jgi:hypothetical protein
MRNRERNDKTYHQSCLSLYLYRLSRYDANDVVHSVCCTHHLEATLNNPKTRRSETMYPSAEVYYYYEWPTWTFLFTFRAFCQGFLLFALIYHIGTYQHGERHSHQKWKSQPYKKFLCAQSMRRCILWCDHLYKTTRHWNLQPIIIAGIIRPRFTISQRVTCLSSSINVYARLYTYVLYRRAKQEREKTSDEYTKNLYVYPDIQAMMTTLKVIHKDGRHIQYITQ